MRINTKIFIFITIIAFVFNCGKSDETYTVEMKDGVRHVHNLAPSWGVEPKVELEFMQQIGDLETEDENYQLFYPWDVTVDEEGNIYVVNNGDHCIKKYSKQGKYISTIGREGQGPGEFQSPQTIDHDSKGNLYVCNGGQSHILVITKDGYEIKRVRLSNSRLGFRLTHSGKIVAKGSRRDGERIAKNIQLIALHDTNGLLLKKFCNAKDYGNDEITFKGNNFEMCVDKDDNTYAAFKEQNRIEKYSPEGSLLFRTDRSLINKPGFNKEKSRNLGSFFVPGFNIASIGIGIDHKNRLWIPTYQKEKEEGEELTEYCAFEIYNNEGVLLGKLPVPRNFYSMRIFDDRLFLIDTYNEMCVYEYKIVEK